MPFSIRSSHLRYRDYRRKLRERRQRGDFSSADSSFHGGDRSGPSDRPPRKRVRSFFTLLREFFKLARGHRARIATSLFALTIATVIGLLPPYGIKLVFDGALTFPPKTLKLAKYLPLPQNPYHLLAAVALTMIALTLLSQLFQVWSRWNDTLATQRVRVSVRRKTFEHAVRLPLHRVQELKSGGVTSMLREDAGGVGDLVFSMLHNPWRAIIQLIGSLIILATVDWRLLLGSFVLFPAVYFTHRTWISRIRPVYRDIRNTRQGIDAHATEAFGGMRVVRSFSRQRYETTGFTSGNHLMSRQEIYAWWWSRGIDIAWSIFIPAATAVVLWYFGARIISDHQRVVAGTLEANRAMTIGDLMMFLTYLAWLLGPLSTLAGSATALQNQLAGMDRILDLLAEPTEMPPAPTPSPSTAPESPAASPSTTSTFAYPVTEKYRSNGVTESRSEGEAHPVTPLPRHPVTSPAPVLHDISLDIHPGEMIALVGPSGAGKDHALQPHRSLLRPHRGHHPPRWHRPARHHRRFLPPAARQSSSRIPSSSTAPSPRTSPTAPRPAHSPAPAGARRLWSRSSRPPRRPTPTASSPSSTKATTRSSANAASNSPAASANASPSPAPFSPTPRSLILDEATSNLDNRIRTLLIQSSLHTLMAGRTSFVIASTASRPSATPTALSSWRMAESSSKAPTKS